VTIAVIVVVPAHDEEDHVATTLRSVRSSLENAARLGLVDTWDVELVAHRCTDRTAARAAQVLADHGRVTHDETSVTVGEVRDAGVRRALHRLGTAPAGTWVLSTDADTTVGPGWATSILRAAAAHDVVGVVGVTSLDRWRGTAAAAAAYDRLLLSKVRGTEGELHQHDHVYGANLAVRADAYLDVGGFPTAVHGEDQAIVDALAARGHRLLRTRDIGVVTSGRLDGRAPEGLATHLRRLQEQTGGAGVRLGPAAVPAGT
jgi:cellulose synthase/poly-beta-1,6-N-acetylglucosamine synthase-like glycosyltransferase